MIVSNKKPVAVVAGLQLVTGLNTVWSLSAMKVPVIGLTDSLDHFASKTITCQKFYCPDVHGEALLDSLVDLAKYLGQKAVLFLTSDHQVDLVARHTKLLEPYYHITWPSEKITKLLLHKTMFSEFADKNGFEIPQTMIITEETDYTAVVDSIVLPCILKPFDKSPSWQEFFGSTKAIKIYDRDVLVDTVAKAMDCVHGIVVQQWIPGADDCIYFDLVYFDKESKCRGIFSGRKIRQWPPSTGSTSSAEPSDRLGQQGETIRLFDSLGFTGLGSVEYKLDHRDNKMKIMEPTVGRPDLQSYISVINGVNLPYLAYCDLTGTESPPVPNQVSTKRVKWICEWEELESARLLVSQNKLTWRKWLKSLGGPKKYAVFSLNDPWPFVITVQLRFRALFKKLLG